jgi:hypothetical protein
LQKNTFTSKGTLHSCLFENDFGFISIKYRTPFSKGTVQNDTTLPLYARHDVTSCKECHILEKNLAAQGMYWRILIRK